MLLICRERCLDDSWIGREKDAWRIRGYIEKDVLLDDSWIGRKMPCLMIPFVGSVQVETILKKDI